MKRTKSSKKWLKEHFSDQYVKMAQSQGYRSRAVFKLLEIQEKDKIFKPGMTVVDLGAAPGGWSQLARKIIGAQGKVIASDILPIEPLDGVDFVQGDFTQEEILEILLEKIGSNKADILISDMAPNMSGIKAVDQPRSMFLAELAFDAAQILLKSDANFLVKVFQGAGFDQYLLNLRRNFAKVYIRKPEASRDRSSEIYLLGLGYIGNVEK